MKIVLITWLDAVGGDGWVTLQELESEKPCIHKSIGFLVNETPEFVTITMSEGENKENMGAWLCIPKLYIKSIVDISQNVKS